VHAFKKVRRLSVLHARSRAGATFVGRLTIAGQAAQKIAEQLADWLADDNIAVSIADTGKTTSMLAIYFPNARDKKKLRAAVAAALGRTAARALRFSQLDAFDWVSESLQGLAPVDAGRFLVHGAHDRGRVPTNRVGIEIEAALAFGSGHHGTTRGCLLALDRISKSVTKPKRVIVRRHPQALRMSAARILDIGTGSGVLSIAAARMLHRRVIATDIDRDAVTVARANVRSNRATTLVRVAKTNGVPAPGLAIPSSFDVIFANILLEPLTRLAVPLRGHIAPGGRIILSGLLRRQANAAIAAYRPLALESRIELEDWVTLVLVRRSLPRSRFRRSGSRANANSHETPRR
jgi:ribosomal protein L11 methyltransferase